MYFKNRDEAARRLAARLARYRGQTPLVLAIPRGAVPMGRILAEELEGELDLVLVRKLGAPGNPELAVGSVSETGEIMVHPWARDAGLSQEYVDAEARRQLEVIRSRRELYTPGKPPADPAGRVVMVLDDGVATGATMLAALELARGRKPRRLLAVTPVAPRETIKKLAQAADEVVCLASPEPFLAVGCFYDDFSQVTDAEVVAALADHERVPAAS